MNQRQHLAAKKGILPALQQKRELPVPTLNTADIYDVFKFRRFRLNVIGFLKLPLNVSESALREVIKESSTHLFVNYMSRAERAGAGYLARSEAKAGARASAGAGADAGAGEVASAVAVAAAPALAQKSEIRIAC